MYMFFLVLLIGSTSAFLPNGCPVSGHWLLPHETFCNKYYQCEYGNKVLRTCAPGTQFDIQLQICNWPHRVDCILGIRPEVATPENKYQSSTSNPRRHPVVPSASNDEKLPNGCPVSGHWLLPHETFCNKYYQCNHGGKVLMTCAPGTQFDIQLQICNWPHRFDCILGIRPEVATPKNKYESSTKNPRKHPELTSASNDEKLPNDCPDSGHWLLPHETFCNKYYQCNHGSKVLRTCAPGTQFDIQLQICNWPHRFDCILGIRPEVATPENRYESSTRNPRKYPVLSSSAVDKLPNGCPADYSVHMLLPHETDCSKFYSCSNGNNFLMDCGPGTVFDFDNQICNWPYLVNCQSVTTTSSTQSSSSSETNTLNPGPSSSLPNGCPSDLSTQTLLPHETDCDKFYSCNKGEKILMSCPTGTLFDANQQICNWPDFVECSYLTSPETTPPSTTTTHSTITTSLSTSTSTSEIPITTSTVKPTTIDTPTTSTSTTVTTESNETSPTTEDTHSTTDFDKATTDVYEATSSVLQSTYTILPEMTTTNNPTTTHSSTSMLTTTSTIRTTTIDANTITTDPATKIPTESDETKATPTSTIEDFAESTTVTDFDKTTTNEYETTSNDPQSTNTLLPETTTINIPIITESSTSSFITTTTIPTSSSSITTTATDIPTTLSPTTSESDGLDATTKVFPISTTDFDTEMTDEYETTSSIPQSNDSTTTTKIPTTTDSNTSTYITTSSIKPTTTGVPTTIPPSTITTEYDKTDATTKITLTPTTEDLVENTTETEFITPMTNAYETTSSAPQSTNTIFPVTSTSDIPTTINSTATIEYSTTEHYSQEIISTVTIDNTVTENATQSAITTEGYEFSTSNNLNTESTTKADFDNATSAHTDGIDAESSSEIPSDIVTTTTTNLIITSTKETYTELTTQLNTEVIASETTTEFVQSTTVDGSITTGLNTEEETLKTTTENEDNHDKITSTTIEDSTTEINIDEVTKPSVAATTELVQPTTGASTEQSTSGSDINSTAFTTATTAPNPPVLPDCPLGTFGNFPHPERCDAFYMCAGGVAILFNCTQGFEFDIDQRTCIPIAPGGCTLGSATTVPTEQFTTQGLTTHESSTDESRTTREVDVTNTDAIYHSTTPGVSTEEVTLEIATENGDSDHKTTTTNDSTTDDSTTELNVNQTKTTLVEQVTKPSDLTTEPTLPTTNASTEQSTIGSDIDSTAFTSTTTTASNAPVLPDCPLGTFGNFPHPERCDAFYMCAGGVAILFNCTQGFEFDIDQRTCIPIAPGGCTLGSATTVPTEQFTTQGLTTHESSTDESRTTREVDVTNTDAIYHSTTPGVSTEEVTLEIATENGDSDHKTTTTNDSTTDDSTTELNVNQTKTTSVEQVTKPSDLTTEPTLPTTNASTEQSTIGSDIDSTAFTSTTTTASNAPVLPDCPLGIFGNFPHPERCDAFYMCAGGVAILFNCTQGFEFDIDQRTCIPIAPGGCTLGSATTVPTEQFTTQGLTTHESSTDESRTTREVDVTNTDAIYHSTTPGVSTEEVTLEIATENGDSDHKTTTTNDSTTELNVDQTKTTSVEQVTKPSDLTTEPTLPTTNASTEQSTIGSDIDSTALTSTTTTASNAPVLPDCPLGTFGNFPHPERCDAFYMCAGGVAILFDCTQGFEFDIDQRTCIPIAPGGCTLGSATTVPTELFTTQGLTTLESSTDEFSTTREVDVTNTDTINHPTTPGVSTEDVTLETTTENGDSDHKTTTTNDSTTELNVDQTKTTSVEQVTTPSDLTTEPTMPATNAPTEQSSSGSDIDSTAFTMTATTGPNASVLPDCPLGTFGNFPHPERCDAFYMCAGGVAILFNCTQGFEFDIDQRTCIPIAPGGCTLGSATTVPTEQFTTQGLTTHESSTDESRTTREVDVTNTDAIYHSTTPGVSTEEVTLEIATENGDSDHKTTTTNDSTTDDSTTELNVNQTKTTSVEQVTKPSDLTTEPTLPTTNASTEQSTIGSDIDSTAFTSTTTTASNAPVLPDCPLGIFGNFPHPERCDAFYMCAGGVAILFNCTQGFEFDIDQRTCIPIALGGCTLSSATTVPTELFTTQGLTTLESSTDESSTTREVDVTNSDTINHPTTPGVSTEEVTLEIATENGDSDHKTTTTNDSTTEVNVDQTKTTSVEQVTTPSDLSTEPTLPATNAPTEQSTSESDIDSTAFTMTATTAPNAPVLPDCPLGTFGNFPHSERCDAFYMCAGGVAILFNCTQGFEFDIDQRTCIPIASGGCTLGSATTVPTEVFTTQSLTTHESSIDESSTTSEAEVTYTNSLNHFTTPGVSPEEVTLETITEHEDSDKTTATYASTTELNVEQTKTTSMEQVTTPSEIATEQALPTTDASTEQYTDGSATGNTASTTAATSAPIPPVLPDCPLGSFGNFPHPERCDAYFMCAGGVAIMFNCTQGFEFDIDQKTCMPIAPGGCTLGSPTTVPSEVFTTQDLNTHDAYSTTREVEATYTVAADDAVMTTSAPSSPVLPECPLGTFGNLPHPERCDAFYMCAGGVAILFNCTQGFEFNTDQKTCMPIAPGGCTMGPATSVAFSTQGLTITDVFSTTFMTEVTSTVLSSITTTSAPNTPVLPDCPLGTFGNFPHPERCDAYYMCAGGIAILFNCTQGFEFDIDQKNCVLITPGGCTLGNIKNSADTLSENISTDSVPNSKKEKNTTQKRITRTVSRDEIITNEEPVNTTDISVIGVCQDSVDDIVPHPDECNSFYLCPDRMMKQLYCSQGYEYDADTKTCQLISENGCTLKRSSSKKEGKNNLESKVMH